MLRKVCYLFFCVVGVDGLLLALPKSRARCVLTRATRTKAPVEQKISLDVAVPPVEEPSPQNILEAAAEAAEDFFHLVSRSFLEYVVNACQILTVLVFVGFVELKKQDRVSLRRWIGEHVRRRMELYQKFADANARVNYPPSIPTKKRLPPIRRAVR